MGQSTSAPIKRLGHSNSGVKRLGHTNGSGGGKNNLISEVYPRFWFQQQDIESVIHLMVWPIKSHTALQFIFLTSSSILWMSVCISSNPCSILYNYTEI